MSDEPPDFNPRSKADLKGATARMERAPPGPMAFTVDFGESKDKKLALKDGIKHFAPSKKPSSGGKDVGVLTSKDNSLTLKPSLVLDEENNHVALTIKDQDQQSDTGTYTIDEEDEAQKDKQSLDEALGLHNKDNHEWVKQWAVEAAQVDHQGLTSTAKTSIYGSDSPTSSTDRDEGSKSRRKLPATPADMLVASKHSSDTENYLQDTITVMAAMEARIDSSKGSPKKKSANPNKSRNNVQMAQVREKEERKIAWERRKNYDPLKAVGKKPQQQSGDITPGVSPRSPRFGHNMPLDHESCSDTCSELESSQSGGRDPFPPQLSSTRPNRAFALRKKLNAPNPVTPAAKSVPNSNSSSFPRGDGGRFSLRGTKNSSPLVMSSSVGPMKKLGGSKKMASDARSTSSLSSKEAEFQAWKRRKNYNPLASSGLAGPSRKSPMVNKNPSTPSRGDILPSIRGKPSNSRLGLQNGHVANGNHGIGDSKGLPMQRAASFHYPDGLSRVHHNVYSSEDESPDQEFTSLSNWENSDLFELNEDELILPIGAGKVRSKPSSMAGMGGRSSHGRMEALDNLVISTIFSISTKLCLNSASLIRRAQDNSTSEEQHSIMDTLLYVLEDTEAPASPSKKTSRELAGTLRNLKKVEQALQLLEGACFDNYDDTYDDDADDETNK